MTATTFTSNQWEELTKGWSADADCQRGSTCTPWQGSYDDQGDCVMMYCPGCRTCVIADDNDACCSDPGGEVVTCATCRTRLHCCGEEL